LNLAEDRTDLSGRIPDPDQAHAGPSEREGFCHFKNLFILRETEKAGERFGALKGVFEKGILFRPAKEARVGMGENMELDILNSDIQNALTKADIRYGLLERKLSIKFSHLSAVKLKGDDPRPCFSPDGYGEPLAFPG